MRPVLHRQLDFFFILADKVRQVVHLLFRVLAELSHDQALLKVTLVEVILDEHNCLLAVELGKFQHLRFHCLF